jgi:hypothetical protein
MPRCPVTVVASRRVEANWPPPRCRCPRSGRGHSAAARDSATRGDAGCDTTPGRTSPCPWASRVWPGRGSCPVERVGHNWGRWLSAAVGRCKAIYALPQPEDPARGNPTRKLCIGLCERRRPCARSDRLREAHALVPELRSRAVNDRPPLQQLAEMAHQLLERFFCMIVGLNAG